MRELMRQKNCEILSASLAETLGACEVLDRDGPDVKLARAEVTDSRPKLGMWDMARELT